MAMLMPRPIAALKASLTTIIAVFRFVRSQVSIPMANSRPANRPRNTQVVLIGTSLHSLKNSRIEP